MIDVLAWVSLACVLLALAIAAWNVRCWPPVGSGRLGRAGAISVLVPARDEGINIGACVSAALRGGRSVGEVIVYDDRSSDDTSAVVRTLAAQDPRVRLVSGASLPEGWCGKTHACARLAEAAAGEWLLYLDADARLEPEAADRLLAEAEGRGATLLSAWPALVMETFWERALMPMLNVLTFSLFPAPLSFVRGDPSLGLVHGACMLMRRDTYRRVGGHAAVRGEIFEDQRLARLWRARGMRGLCLDGQDAVSVRMYRSLADIWQGFQKNFYPAFQRERSFWGFLFLHALVFVVPVLLIVMAPSWPAIGALAGLAAIRILFAVHFRTPIWPVLLHPLAEVVLLGIAFGSWWRCRSGRGVEWKGRRYLASNRRTAAR